MTDSNNNKTAMIVKYGGFALIGMALCYLILFIIYGAFIGAATSNTTSAKIANLLQYKQLVQLTYIIGYLIFACLLTIVVQAINNKYCYLANNLIALASMFGLCWAIALFSTGMIGITSLELLSELTKTQDNTAQVIYQSSVLLVQSLGGGIELLGGLWVGLLGVFAWQQHSFSKSFALFSIVKGIIGIATVFSSTDILRDLFGVSGIVWFLWLAKIMLNNKPDCLVEQSSQ